MPDSNTATSGAAPETAHSTARSGMRTVIPKPLRQFRDRVTGNASSRQRPARPRQNLTMKLRKWHQRAGLAAFLFMTWLGATGLLINQSAPWGYDTLRIDWPWVTNGLYGLSAVPPQEGYKAGGHWITKAGDAIVLDGEAVEYAMNDPHGMAMGEGPEQALLFIATRSSVVVLTEQGAIYDELRSPVLPVSEPQRLGTRDADGAVVVAGADDAYASTDGGFTWQPADDVADVRWSEAEALAEAEREALMPFSQPSMSVERVLLDVHSGQIFGDFGKWVVNIVGVLAIVLGITGVWMYWRMNRRRRS